MYFSGVFDFIIFIFYCRGTVGECWIVNAMVVGLNPIKITFLRFLALLQRQSAALSFATPQANYEMYLNKFLLLTLCI